MATLSKRELEVVELISQGLTARAISIQLDIRQRTVDAHTSNILTKLKAKNAPHIVSKCYQIGILS